MTPTDWQETTLGEITSKIGSGSTPTGGSNVYKTSGISFIRSQNILDLKFSKDGLVYIDEVQAKQLNNVTVEPEDILLNITGDSVARSCLVDPIYLPARVNQHVAIVRVDDTKSSFHFVAYSLQYLKEELLSQSEIGATRRALTKSILEDLKLFIPPLPEQRAIADVLSSLDAKIDLLHRQNQTLEALAETLFRQWFIEEANPEWEYSTIKQYVSTIDNRGKTPPNISEQTKYPIIEVNALGKNSRLIDYSLIRKYVTEDTFNTWFRGKPKKFSTLISTVGSIGFLSMYLLEVGNIAQNIICLEPKKISPFYLYQYLKFKTEDILNLDIGGVQPSIKVPHLLDLELLIPSREKLDAFDVHALAMVEKMETNYIQIQTLERLRDALLPKLMAGSVRVGHYGEGEV